MVALKFTETMPRYIDNVPSLATPMWSVLEMGRYMADRIMRSACSATKTRAITAVIWALCHFVICMLAWYQEEFCALRPGYLTALHKIPILSSTTGGCTAEWTHWSGRMHVPAGAPLPEPSGTRRQGDPNRKRWLFIPTKVTSGEFAVATMVVRLVRHSNMT